MRILFVEPPKDVWFVMGEYLPPPYGIIQLGAYLEKSGQDVEIEVLDCNAKEIDWRGLESCIASARPDIVASSSLATCNTYLVVRTLETAKKVDPGILTVAGGQHFTATADESLRSYPVIDVIVRGEGEVTLTELVSQAKGKDGLSSIKGISFRRGGETIHTPDRPLIEDLEDLPFPGYHLVRDTAHKYHFNAMMPDAGYALVEGSRGCPCECTFCTQWRHWGARHRVKSAKRIADEFEYCHRKFGSRFIWLTDDNLGSGSRASDLADEIIKRGIGDDIAWFVQARCDDVIRNREALPRLRRSGLSWVLMGVENSEPSTLQDFNKGIRPQDAEEAVKLLKQNDIFAHAMLIIGNRKDTRESIARLRVFAHRLDPDFAMFSVLTPFPGTEIYEEAVRNGWIQDWNWSHYDMIHAVMSTETLSAKELQEELYECYQSFYGSWTRRLEGLLSRNGLKRRIHLDMARRGIVGQLRTLF